MRVERAIAHAVLATGIASVVTQLVTIRELLTQFQGNEIVIALILFAWLIIGGVGTLLSRLAVGPRRPATGRRLAWLSLSLAATAPLQLLAIRHFRDVVFIHGASVGFYPTLGFIFAVIAPYSLMVGFVLPYSLYVLRNRLPRYPGARIYILDNLGDVTGGALFSFLLVLFLSPLQSLFLAHLPLLVAAVRLLPPGKRLQPAPLAGVLAAALLLVGGVALENASLEPGEGKLLEVRETRYGRLSVRGDQTQVTLFEDGIPVFSSQNRIIAEESVHYPLSQLVSPADILLIAAEGGVMHEIAKYHPRSVDYVELNPAVSDIVFRYGLLAPIPGLKVIHRDGRAYLRQSSKTYDAILVNLPEPDTFQVNRFFTAEFFALARRHLAPEGILCFSAQGFDNYLAEPQRQKLSALRNTAAGLFRTVVLLPGQKTYFLCRNRPVDTDVPALLAEKGIRTDYIEGFYGGNVSRWRIDNLRALLDADTPVNTDTAPQLMRIMFQQWFAKYADSPAPFFIAFSVLAVIYLVRCTREEFVLFSTGCMTMAGEILVIFAFQIYFGYIYFQIGVIVTVFLAGLLPGAVFGNRVHRYGRRLLPLTDGVLIGLMGLFITALAFVGSKLPVAFFLAFGFAVSLVCGFQFPVALALRGDDNPAAARFFSADLIGAAAGTLVTSLILIPYLGILWAAAAFIGLKLASIVVMGGSRA
jgi:spermidine synthase